MLDPIRETLPHIIYEFCSDKVIALLSFNYERTIGLFCRVCGLLEHAAIGCGGPPDLLHVQVLRGGPQAPNGGGFSSGFGSGATSGFSFSILGISASELASNIEKFRSPLPLAALASILEYTIE
ncbi:hypothetical protein ACLB2K_059219 [Fragaria x ananassa]